MTGFSTLITFLILISLISCKGQSEKMNMILGDQTLPHESGPHGVNPEEEWAQRPLILQGIIVPEYDTLGRKEPFKAIIAWGQVYEAIEGNPAKDVRVQLKNLKTYLFSKSTGKWELVNSTKNGKINGAYYRENWEDNYNTKQDVREED